MPLVRVPLVSTCAYFAPLVKKKFARKHPERLGFLYTDNNIETYEKRNLDPVIYVISKLLA